MVWKKIGAAFFITLLSGSVQLASAQDSQQSPNFVEYLDALKHEAKEQGIENETVDRVFPKIKPFKRAVFTGKTQVEPKTSLETFLPATVPEWKVEKARQLFKEHSAELKALGDKYDVQPRFIIALLGIVSDFGVDSGHLPLLSVLASSAYEGSKEAFFRDEFFSALKIIEQNDIDFDNLKGSWTGVMGQTHFTPSQYLLFAQDGDGDGKSDIWNNTQDTFASLAYFLQQAGWKSDGTWGRQVLVPKEFDLSHSSLDIKKTFSQWSALGVTRFDGSKLPSRNDMQISLIMPDGAIGRKYLVYDNYRALLKWNESDYFALSVTYLSERIKYPAIK
ncbi:lytic murein transglycosylase [Shewanella atlantica]|uniref:Lytic murein transglycosylase n=1 Tax=Shewanella atlantica TaxID=271099 RepID=A0A3S0IDR9_9GAMM|nr:lytic murein transglycosylase [Shewanella atlantica]RTR33229.1 lytic murein transglycosylase [Shewanella atlantica]